jgi:hypothetical protein
MKCLKNKNTGDIIRVDDKQAHQMVGTTWQFIPKSEWKSQVRIAKTEVQTVQEEKKEKTVSEKALRHSKLKSKQRSSDISTQLIKK